MQLLLLLLLSFFNRLTLSVRLVVFIDVQPLKNSAPFRRRRHEASIEACDFCLFDLLPFVVHEIVSFTASFVQCCKAVAF